MGDNYESEEEVWRLTQYACLELVLNDYGINTDRLTPKIGECIVNDLLELLCKQGYINKVSG